MTTYIILAVLILVMLGAIAYLAPRAQTHAKSEEAFVKKIVKFLQGICDAPDSVKWTMGENKHSFSIKFIFEGYEFVLGSVDEKIFGGRVEKVFLKTIIPTPFILSFSEMEGSMMTRLDMTLISKVEDTPRSSQQAVNIPKDLKTLHIFTNNIEQTNRLFSDPKIVRILTKFKNVDHRGYPFMALKVIEGVVILEFYPSYVSHPSLYALRNNVSLIENYLVDLKEIMQKLKAV